MATGSLGRPNCSNEVIASIRRSPPFCNQLSAGLAELFSEEHLYRIDHYLGKEMVQNLICLRFANEFLEPLWNRNHVECVLITFKVRRVA